MNFFESQDRSRRRTRWLVAMFVLATLIVVAAVTLIIEVATSGAFVVQGVGSVPFRDGAATRLALIALGVLIFIFLASAFRTARLSAGGGQVAREMGGTLVNPDSQDLLRQRLRNVVEEMAIASGVPVPEIYVLEEESSINAFAAGFSPSDAAVAVTRGTLETLNRDELQGVIAHEFSHILNGDMRLNIRLMGVLFGIIVLGQIGRLLMRSGSRSRISVLSSNRRGSGSAAVVIGLAVFVVGSVGVLMARLIRAGVSRQREYLADASAVQFTRQTDGIAGALKKIAGYEDGSAIRAADAEEVSHMLFARGVRRHFLGALATHPPIEDRIRALDPSFDPAKLTATVASAGGVAGDSAASAFAGSAAGPIPLNAGALAESAGNPDNRQVALAGTLRASIPAALYDAAHSREWSYYLVIALALHHDEAHREQQYALLASRVGPTRLARIRQYANTVDSIGSRYRLPLLDVCFPALKERPVGQLKYLLELIDELIRLDERHELFEYAFARTLAAYLEDALHPGRPGKHRLRHFEQGRTRRSAYLLLELLAMAGHKDAAAARQAYAAGVERLRPAGATGPREEPSFESRGLADMDKAIAGLRGLIGRDLEMLLQAMVATIEHDGHVNIREAELLRTVCAALGCPLPPLAAD
jgi:Zn-dependent protease with chaperone function